MGAADRAIGILAQLQFAELHAQRVDQQQASGQRIALPQNQLDGLGRLDHADQAGQNAEHSTFGARRHQTGRWRLGIETAIAGAVFGREHAGLAFKTKNRAVNIGLAGEHAGVVDQVAGGEIVGAIGDDVELAK